MKRFLELLHDTYGQHKLTVISDAWGRAIGYQVTDLTNKSLAYFTTIREGVKALTPTEEA